MAKFQKFTLSQFQLCHNYRYSEGVLDEGLTGGCFGGQCTAVGFCRRYRINVTYTNVTAGFHPLSACATWKD